MLKKNRNLGQEALNATFKEMIEYFITISKNPEVEFQYLLKNVSPEFYNELSEKLLEWDVWYSFISQTTDAELSKFLNNLDNEHLTQLAAEPRRVDIIINFLSLEKLKSFIINSSASEKNFYLKVAKSLLKKKMMNVISEVALQKMLTAENGYRYFTEYLNSEADDSDISKILKIENSAVIADLISQSELQNGVKNKIWMLAEKQGRVIEIFNEVNLISKYIVFEAMRLEIMGIELITQMFSLLPNDAKLQVEKEFKKLAESENEYIRTCPEEIYNSIIK